MSSDRRAGSTPAWGINRAVYETSRLHIQHFIINDSLKKTDVQASLTVYSMDINNRFYPGTVP